MKLSNERTTLGSPQTIMWTSKGDKTKRRRGEVGAVKGEDAQNVVIRSRPDFAASLAHSRSKSGLSEVRSVAPVEGL